MGPLYQALGLTVAAITQGSSRDERRAAYAADVTYLAANEAGPTRSSSMRRVR